MTGDKRLCCIALTFNILPKASYTSMHIFIRFPLIWYSRNQINEIDIIHILFIFYCLHVKTATMKPASLTATSFMFLNCIHVSQYNLWWLKINSSQWYRLLSSDDSADITWAPRRPETGTTMFTSLFDPLLLFHSLPQHSLFCSSIM